jgi:hypothetical protein
MAGPTHGRMALHWAIELPAFLLDIGTDLGYIVFTLILFLLTQTLVWRMTRHEKGIPFKAEAAPQL